MGCFSERNSIKIPCPTCFLCLILRASLTGTFTGDFGFFFHCIGLLSALAYALEAGAPDSLVESFHVMGGQCNYLLRAVVKRDNDGLNPREG